MFRTSKVDLLAKYKYIVHYLKYFDEFLYFCLVYLNYSLQVWYDDMKGGRYWLPHTALVAPLHITQTGFYWQFICLFWQVLRRLHSIYIPSFNIQNITMNLNSSESLAAEHRGCGANRNNYKIVCLLYYLLYYLVL